MAEAEEAEAEVAEAEAGAEAARLMIRGVRPGPPWKRELLSRQVSVLLQGGRWVWREWRLARLE